MTAPSGSPDKGRERASEAYEHVACPFCGIMCDDLQIARTGANLKVRNTNCEKAVAGFERALAASSPQIDGKTVSLEAAVRAAAELVREARLPMFGGLATDVEGMRAVMSLADRTGGVVDHALSDAQFRNFRVLQSSGWITTTLTETSQSRRSHRHRRHGRAKAASALLRADRLHLRIHVCRAGAEARRRVHRQGPR